MLKTRQQVKQWSKQRVRKCKEQCYLFCPETFSLDRTEQTHFIAGTDRTFRLQVITAKFSARKNSTSI